VALDELLERPQVTRERSAHEGLIGIGGHGGCDPSRSRKVTSFSVRGPVNPSLACSPLPTPLEAVSLNILSTAGSP
jgi:hypothetical protein